MGTAQVSLLASFTRGLRGDNDAVRAALTEPWSTGPVGVRTTPYLGFDRDPMRTIGDQAHARMFVTTLGATPPGRGHNGLAPSVQPGINEMTLDERQRAARRFLSVLGHPDPEVIESVAAEDLVWRFPGTARISGEGRGIEGAMNRARVIASYGVKVEIVRTVFGHQGLAMMLHNTGERADRILDEHLAAVFTFRDDRIVRQDTFLSDVPMMEAFFA